MTDLGPGFVLSLACLTAGVTLYFFLQASHTERMAKIERGLLDADGERAGRGFFAVKSGMFCAGLGLGLLAAFATERMTRLTDAFVLYPALMFLCGGLSLLASYFLVEHLRRKA